MNLKGEGTKITNAKREKLTMKELKKQVQGITLIALVVTISRNSFKSNNRAKWNFQ